MNSTIACTCPKGRGPVRTDRDCPIHGSLMTKRCICPEGTRRADCPEHRAEDLIPPEDVGPVVGDAACICQPGMIQSNCPGAGTDHGLQIRPDYYGGAADPYEVRKVVAKWGLGFNLGNALKYIARAGKKPGSSAIEDLKKAMTYLGFEIEERS